MYDFQRLAAGPSFDSTLAEVRTFLRTCPSLEAYDPATLVIRFCYVVWVGSPEPEPGLDLPDSMTLAEFSSLARCGRAMLMIEGDWKDDDDWRPPHEPVDPAPLAPHLERV